MKIWKWGQTTENRINTTNIYLTELLKNRLERPGERIFEDMYNMSRINERQKAWILAEQITLNLNLGHVSEMGQHQRQR